MAVVKGYAELIETQIENIPPQAKDFAHKIRESVNKLLELVEEFMDYRKIEEGKMELHFEEVDLVSLIKEFVNNFNLIAKEKNLELTFETSMEQCLVKVDKMKFSQVIQNLIDNAIKYTNQGWVKVNLQKEDNSVLITVADSGIGMSKELQQKLFGEFVRDPSIKREIRGTGLGLYIAKYIVEAHQGKIWAESEGENKGSKFYVKLPLN
jgi:signal transduction histidine kinase